MSSNFHGWISIMMSPSTLPIALPKGVLVGSSNICELLLESRLLCAASCQLMLFICEVRRTEFMKHIFKESILRNRICFNLQ